MGFGERDVLSWCVRLGRDKETIRFMVLMIGSRPIRMGQVRLFRLQWRSPAITSKIEIVGSPVAVLANVLPL